jgi:hypothetical protein
MNASEAMIDTRYSRPIKIAIGEMMVAALCGMLALDFGGFRRQIACLILMFSVAIAGLLIARRRSATTGAWDSFIVTYGFLILLAALLVADNIFPAFFEWFQIPRPLRPE